LKSINAQEQQRLMTPLLGFMFVLDLALAGVGIARAIANQGQAAGALIEAAMWGFYVLAVHLFVAHKKWQINSYRWVLAASDGVALAFLTHSLPSSIAMLGLFYYITSIFTFCVTAGRGAAYTLIIATAGTSVLLGVGDGSLWSEVIVALSFSVSGVILAELLLGLFDLIMLRARRLDVINDFARKIALSIETSQVFTLLNAAIENAMDADTYFVGLLGEDGKIRLDLFYDDGEFFPPMTLDPEGTLSGWVLRNRRPLFLPDLRSEPDLEGVTVTIIGKEKTSLSWMGVPILSSHFTGVISIASYTPNAFDRVDMELLENLAQHAASAMDNAYHHAEVERQSQTDSLTGALNHGAFLRALENLAADAHVHAAPLSLIMLDVDYFKSYNDTYGHLFGDGVLQALTKTIREHIKSQDVVGRWGGEEFAVILPLAAGEQALAVARRIQETMYQMRMEHPQMGQVPAPTVSQGLAVYPQETEDIYALVDLADRRLYRAKERGRNQVESGQDEREETRPAGKQSRTGGLRD